MAKKKEKEAKKKEAQKDDPNEALGLFSAEIQKHDSDACGHPHKAIKPKK